MAVDLQREALARAAADMAGVRGRLWPHDRDRGAYMEASIALTFCGEPEPWEGEGEGEDTRPLAERRRLHYANPEHVRARLVYADWCEEFGLQPRADLIRQQIAGEVGPLAVRSTTVKTGKGVRRVYWVENEQRKAKIDGKDYWPGAALDAARHLVDLPFFDWALVCGGFVEAVRFDSYAAAMGYGPFITATHPVEEIHFPGAEPVEADQGWVWYSVPAEGRYDPAVVMRLDGSDGRIPEYLDRQMVDLGRVHGLFPTDTAARWALYRAVARWSALMAYCNNLFPWPEPGKDRRWRKIWRRHASRPVDPE